MAGTAFTGTNLGNSPKTALDECFGLLSESRVVVQENPETLAGLSGPSSSR